MTLFDFCKYKTKPTACADNKVSDQIVDNLDLELDNRLEHHRN